jgi:hypothetical protein
MHCQIQSTTNAAHSHAVPVVPHTPRAIAICETTSLAGDDRGLDEQFDCLDFKQKMYISHSMQPLLVPAQECCAATATSDQDKGLPPRQGGHPTKKTPGSNHYA